MTSILRGLWTDDTLRVRGVVRGLVRQHGSGWLGLIPLGPITLRLDARSRAHAQALVEEVVHETAGPHAALG